MNRFYILPNPDYLHESEIDFELIIRRIKVDPETKLDEKKRTLRNAYAEDRKNPKIYSSNLNVLEEIGHLTPVIESIVNKVRIKFDFAEISRLRHYLIRIVSASVKDEKEAKKKARFCHMIEEVLRDLKQRVTYDPNQSEGNTTDHEQALNNLYGDSRNNPDPKVGPKTSEEKSEGPKIVTPERLAAALAALETKEKEAKLLQDKSTKNDTAASKGQIKHDKNQTRTEDKYKDRKDSKSMRRDKRKSEYDNRRRYSSSDNSSVTNSKTRRSLGSSKISLNDSSSSSSSTEQYSFIRGHGRKHGTPRGNQGTDRYRRGRYEYRSKVEKWEISFSGDSRSIQVEDFLNRVKKLARHEHVGEQELLDKIHYKLKGEASDWWFTREHVCTSWKTFESEIRFRFGNPNRDRGIKRQLRELQQKRGETFVAFVTEVEKLNQCLKRPHSNRTVFELIWENMRPHYRSKLATIRVDNLEHLLDLNHRIDANDVSLFRTGNSTRGEVNKLYTQDLSDDSYSSQDEVQVNAIQRKQKPSRNTQTTSSHRDQDLARGSQASRVNQTAEPSRAAYVTDNSIVKCWNCQKTGHHWRTCQEAKMIFCYACGNLGRTTRTCERNHPAPQHTVPPTQNVAKQQTLN